MAWRHRSQEARRRPAGRLLRATAALVALALGGIVLVAGVLPRLAGATPYTVLTSSMAPSLPAGTLVIVRPVGTSRLGIGDVVTYQLRSGEPEVVTHRIVALEVGVGGETLYRTQGDANPAADPEPVHALQIRGRVWYAVPYVGRISLGLDRQAAARLLALGLLLVAAREFVLAVRVSRRPDAVREEVRHG